MHFVVDRSRPRLLVSGPDAAAFLHRLSTQHVADLKPGDARLAVLTTDKGRIKELIHHVVLESGVLLIGHRQPAADLLAWLDRYLFTEKLTLDDVTAKTACVDVDVETAESLVPGSRALAPWAMKQQGDVVVVRGFDRVTPQGAPMPGFVVVSFGTPLPPGDLSVDDDAAMGLAAGVPDLELSEAHTPLDLDLHDAIHWAKGCYIGQEVIARLDTYGKQRRHLVGLVGDPAGFKVGDHVVAAGTNVGTVTAVAPRGWGAGLPSAFAMVKIASDVGDVVVGPARSPARVAPRAAAQRPHE
ncbi:MAG: hypothetical protein Q8O67_18525 [Deltaproteobacteria bacterium]|nr:hypothetical protein [Deltaproteobacteria bacterium]